MYPRNLGLPYAERRSEAAARRYARTRHSREDHCAREKAVAANWNCFGAPTALFCYIDRRMGAPLWADVGMYLQTAMLLLRTEGLHSRPQMAWSVYHRTVPT
jgi:hypothetical protein